MKEKIKGFTIRYLKELLIAFVFAILVAYLLIYTEIGLPGKSTEKIAKENIKAVNLILCLDKNGKTIASGSGFFITPDGKIVTNYHVIEGCSQLQVKFYTAGFFPIEEILGTDKNRDVAVLKVDGNDLPSVKLGNSDKIEAGEKVIAIGSPLGLEGVVTEGIVSVPKQNIDSNIFIQTTAPISPGNSGGPLLNKKGDVIGVTTGSLLMKMKMGELEFATGETQNLNLAIPINDVKNFLFNKLALEVKKFTENAEYYYLNGVVAYDKKNYNEAKENFQKAISLNDKYTDAYLYLADIYYEKGNYNLELVNYRRAATLDPNSDNLYYLATALEDNGDYKEAVTTYEKALKLNPDNKDALHDLGILYLTLSEYSKAKNLVSRLILLDPGWGNELRILIDRMK